MWFPCKYRSIILWLKSSFYIQDLPSLTHEHVVGPAPGLAGGEVLLCQDQLVSVLRVGQEQSWSPWSTWPWLGCCLFLHVEPYFCFFLKVKKRGDIDTSNIK